MFLREPAEFMMQGLVTTLTLWWHVRMKWAKTLTFHLCLSSSDDKVRLVQACCSYRNLAAESRMRRWSEKDHAWTCKIQVLTEVD
jgi:hypothetical protein